MCSGMHQMSTQCNARICACTMLPLLHPSSHPVPYHDPMQYLFWGPTKKYGVNDSVVDNVRETVLGLGAQLSQLNFRALHMHAS